MFWVKILMKCLNATWPASKNVVAFTTTRQHGVSKPPFNENNLAQHVGDNQLFVEQNRKNLYHQFALPNEPEWLNQTHSKRCVLIDNDLNRDADASVTRTANRVLAIMTADCLPIMISNKQGDEIAAIHAGWRGLADGVIESTLEMLQSPRKDLLAWIGPGICGNCYETKDDVKNTFINRYQQTSHAFINSNDKMYTNLPLLAEIILKDSGISDVYQSQQCTYETKNSDKYFSYRRENQTGRIATLIWFTNHNQNTRGAS